MRANQQNVQLNSVNVERGEGGLVTLQIEVAPESVQAARDRVIKDYSRQLRVPGFRPGHIPANIVRRSVGDENIAQRVSDEIVPAAFQQAMEQSTLTPLDKAHVEELGFDAFEGDKPLQFTARVVVRPEITLGDTTGLALTRPRSEITDEQVEQGLESMRHERATLRNVEGRGAQEGDILSAELRVYIEGQPHQEEPSRLRAFPLGESGFVPSIDEHLIGVELDEERRFNVTYPSDFKDAELAGQIAEFAVTVTSIKERALPEVDDTFAQAMGFDDLDGLRQQMRGFIASNREREAQEALREQAVRAVTEVAQVEPPGLLVDQRVHNRIHNIEHQLEHREASLEAYLESTGKSREEFEAGVRADVERETRQELVLDEIARRENLEVTQHELEAYYVNMANALQQPVEELVEHLEVATVRASILHSKAVDWLVEHANVTETEAPAAAE